MNQINKKYFLVAILLFYFGDIISTYMALLKGFHEGNVFVANIGFVGGVLAKTLFIVMVYFFIAKLESMNKQTEIGIMNGAIIAIGLLTVLNNVRFYGA